MPEARPPKRHAWVIDDQFTRQAEMFAAAAALHTEQALELLVNAAHPEPSDVSLDVACGPGSVVTAFAAKVHGLSGSG